MREEQWMAVIELPSVNDADLLARFVDSRDAEAFAELVRRHGAMVLATCRRVLRHPQDAEDAFQATFIVLAMRAGAIRRREAVPGWLFEVAQRTAMRARSLRRRRDQLEWHLSVMAQMKSTGHPEPSEAASIVDAEIARLAPKYRNPVVLCYLQGKTNVEAGRELSLPVGTIATRLRQARGILRERLLARGINLSVRNFDVMLRGNRASDDVPAMLMASTTAAVSMIPARNAPLPGPVKQFQRAFTLARKVARTVTTAKVALVAALLLAVSICAGVATHALETSPHGVAKVGSSADSDLITFKVVDRLANGGLAGSALCIVADGQEQTIKCDEHGCCTFHRPASVASLIVLSTSPGYVPQFMTWSRGNGPELPMPATVLLPMSRGAVHERMLLRSGSWVHVINPPSTPVGQAVKTVEIDLDAALHPPKKS